LLALEQRAPEPALRFFRLLLGERGRGAGAVGGGGAVAGGGDDVVAAPEAGVGPDGFFARGWLAGSPAATGGCTVPAAGRLTGAVATPLDPPRLTFDGTPPGPWPRGDVCPVTSVGVSWRDRGSPDGGVCAAVVSSSSFAYSLRKSWRMKFRSSFVSNLYPDIIS
jgi:hypothetical protein